MSTHEWAIDPNAFCILEGSKRWVCHRCRSRVLLPDHVSPSDGEDIELAGGTCDEVIVHGVQRS